MEWLYKAMEQYTYIALRSIIFKVIAVAAMFILVKSENDYLIYGGISIFASGASGILNLISAGRFIGFRPVGGYNIRRHLKVVLIFFAMSCATTVYTNLDVVMLGLMKTNTDNGYYAAAVKVKTVLVACVTSLGEVLLPRVSYYIKNNMKDRFISISRKAMNFVLVAAVPLMVYFILYARETVLLLSGEEFLGAVPAMQIIMPTLLFIGITNLMGIEILIPLGREKSVLISVAAGAVCDLVLNLFLIPPHGAAGAALGTLAAEICVMIIQSVMLKEQAAGLFAQISYIRIIAAVAAGTLLCFWVRLTGLRPIWTLLISAVMFFGGYLAILIISREKLTMSLIRDALASVRKRRGA